MQFLVEGGLPVGHRALDAAPEGSCKTILGCGLSVHIAANAAIFGRRVKGGSVLIVDEETPFTTLETLLDRFSQGLGFKDYGDLPNVIMPLSQQGFRFGRRTELNAILD